MEIVFTIFFFIAAIVLGPLIIIFGYLLFRNRTVSKRELRALKDELSFIRRDIEDIKEQIADFIIKTH